MLQTFEGKQSNFGVKVMTNKLKSAVGLIYVNQEGWAAGHLGFNSCFQMIMDLNKTFGNVTCGWGRWDPINFGGKSVPGQGDNGNQIQKFGKCYQDDNSKS